MVGARGIVAGRLGRVIAHEHAAGRSHIGRYVPWVVHRYDKVFGRIGIAEVEHGAAVGKHQYAAVAERLLNKFLARQQCGLALHLGGYFVGKVLALAHQYGLAVGAMLGLRQHVGCHIAGLGGVVGHDEHFGGAGRHVDGRVGAHKLLGMGNETVAGAKYLVHTGYALCAIRHGGNGLCTAHAVDVVNTASIGRIYYFGGDAAVGTLGRAKHHVLATGYAGRGGQHEHGAEERGAAAGYVKSHTLNGYRLLQAAHTGLGFDLDRLGHLRFVKGTDVDKGCVDGLSHLGCDLGRQLLALLGRQFDVGYVSMVKVVCKTAQGFIATVAHLGHNTAHAFYYLVVTRGVALAHFVPYGLIWIDDYLHVE